MTSFKEMIDLIATGKYGEVPTLEDGFTKVSEENERYDIYETITENGDKLTMTIDVEHNRLAFTELFNAMDEPILKKVFQYNEEQTNGDYPVIERTLELVYQKSVEGTIDMVKTITTDFKTFTFSENI